MPNKQRACDRCHRLKEKCTFEPHAVSCTLCERSASHCTTARLQRRQGRRPRAKLFDPASEIQVWEIQSEPLGTEQGRRLIRVTPEASFLTMADNETLHRPTARSAPSLPSPFDSTPRILERFAAKYGIFMLGPSFTLRFRQALQHAYRCSPSLLQDVFTIVFPETKSGEHNSSIWQQLNTRKGAASLQILRTAQVRCIQDAFAILALGRSLAAFELLTHCTGCKLILQHSLHLIRPWYGELAKDSSLDPVTISAIFWDTVCCLVRREIPVIKFQSQDPPVVDHLAGYCTTMAPLLFDLCVVSNRLKNTTQSHAQRDVDAVSEIEERLLAWAPEDFSESSHDEFSYNFSEQEKLGMKAQACMYNIAGLLVAHRILNPIGVLDDVAVLYANAIMLEVSNYSMLVVPESRLPFVAFPILMAALEIPTVPKDIWSRITLLDAAPICAAKMAGVVEYVWAQRRVGCVGYLLDFIDAGPDFVITP